MPVSNITKITKVCITAAHHSVRGQFDSNGEHPLKYWRTLAIKLSFVILFEVRDLTC